MLENIDVTSLFFSYSHKDEDLRDQLETHLAGLKRQGFIETWHDRRILAGQELSNEIDIHLEEADIILLLISPDFIASDYCYGIEMTRALERHNKGEARVIPVILRHCDWKDLPFGKLLATPTDGKPIKQWADIDEAFLDVVKSVKQTLKQHNQAPMDTRVLASVSSAAESSSDIRSSNLRITKHFTDHDKDEFLHEAFEYCSKLFENSVTELSVRSPEIKGKFRQIDANRFTATLYRNGKSVSGCTVFIGAPGFGAQSLCYSSNDDGQTNTINFTLRVEHDDQKLYLSPGLSFVMTKQDNDKLSLQGGAESLWEQFIQPLQRSY